jgi:hypothetical protein
MVRELDGQLLWEKTFFLHFCVVGSDSLDHAIAGIDFWRKV